MCQHLIALKCDLAHQTAEYSLHETGESGNIGKTDNAIAFFVECQYILCVCVCVDKSETKRKWQIIRVYKRITQFLCQAPAYYVIVSAVPNEN